MLQSKNGKCSSGLAVAGQKLTYTVSSSSAKSAKEKLAARGLRTYQTR